MDNVVFKTERMTLRAITQEYLDELFKLFSDPIVMQHFPKTLTKEEVKARIDKILFNYQTHSAGLWACHLQETGAFIGKCGLKFQKNIDGHDEVEVSYILALDFWNQGLATEAVKGTLVYAKSVLSYTRVISLIRLENYASRKVAEKNGLALEKEVDYKGRKHLLYSINF